MHSLEDLFNRVAFDEGDREIHRQAYKSVKDIAIAMNASAPDCEDKSLAFRALQLALMHFGEALSRNPKYQN